MNKPISPTGFPFVGGLDFRSDSTTYKTLLESTLAIPWKIDWATMTFAYIGPQIEPLLGWSQDSWLTVDDWSSRIHEEDRQRVVDFCVSQSMSGIDHEADYRALTKDGGFVWIRDVVHVVRTPDGEVDSLVGFMFDITERKNVEQQLVETQKKLEALSFEDGLTGIANRRLFDRSLDTEWAGAQRSGQPLSLILLDLDHFKQFNDSHGHLAGDECLRTIAQALGAVRARPRDVVARFGGEEFALLLPETDAAGAMRIAENCQAALADCAIVHAGSPIGGRVTASVGVGTVCEPGTMAAATLIEAVDAALYAAKQAGRNRIVTATLG